MYHDQHNTRPGDMQIKITRNSEGADRLEVDGIAAGSASVAASSCQERSAMASAGAGLGVLPRH